MAAYDRVKYLIGDDALLMAWERAQALDAPVEVTQLFRQPEIHLLACLCRELQRSWGKEPFYLSCRTVEKLFSVAYSTGSLWLRGLEGCGVIKIIIKGDEISMKASRYRYLLPIV